MVDETENPDTIEREIERTQDQMGETIAMIEEKLTPSEITRTALGDEGQELVREVLRMVRENPVPAAMIAVGTIWLFATSGSPLIKRVGDRLSNSLGGSAGDRADLRSRSEEPAPIGPPPARGEEFDRRREPLS